MNKKSVSVYLIVITFFVGFVLGIYFRPILDIFNSLINESDIMSILVILIPIIFSGIIGYILGNIKSFREEKQKAYGESLPAIIRMIFNYSPDDEKDFNKALSKLWLYANKEVAFKIDKVASILVDKERGDMTCAIQEAIVAMRKDIHNKWPFSKIKPEEVKHLYMRIGGINNHA